MHGETLKKETA